MNSYYELSFNIFASLCRWIFHIHFSPFIHKENLILSDQNLLFIPTYEDCPKIVMTSSMWYNNHASRVFVIRNDNTDYRDYGDNSTKVYCTVLHTMKSESWERSSNTNSCLMIVELEALLASHARIMKYGLMDKVPFNWVGREHLLKGRTATMIGFMGASPTSSTGWQKNSIDGVLSWLPPIYQDIVIGYAMQGESFTFQRLWTQWRTMKVEPIAGEIVKSKKGIFDIQVIKVSC
jgi:hypothetical protein